MPVTPPLYVILLLAAIGAAVPALVAAIVRSETRAAILMQGALAGLWTAAVSGVSLLAIEWIDWSLRDHAAWDAVQRECMVESHRSGDAIHYIQAPNDVPLPGAYHPEMKRARFGMRGWEIVIVSTILGVLTALLAMGIGWAARPVSRLTQVSVMPGIVRSIGVFLVVASAIACIPVQWRPFDVPEDADVALRHDLGEAYAGRGPFQTMSTTNLIDRVYPKSGEHLGRNSAEWATLYHRYDARRLSQPEWEEMLRGHFRSIPVLWLPKDVPGGTTVWVRLFRCPWLSGEGRTFAARVEAKLEDSTPFEARWGDGIFPKRSWPVGRAPQHADHVDFVVSLQEIGGELHTRLDLRLRVAIGGRMDDPVALIHHADMTAWVQRNVDLRLDRSCNPPLVFVCRLPTAMTFPGHAGPLGVGLNIEFQHDGRSVARAMAWAEGWARPEPPGQAFAVTGAVEELLSADSSDPKWRVVVSGDADLALSEIDASQAWVGSFSVPLADLKSP